MVLYNNTKVAGGLFRTIASVVCLFSVTLLSCSEYGGLIF